MDIGSQLLLRRREADTQQPAHRCTCAAWAWEPSRWCGHDLGSDEPATELLLMFAHRAYPRLKPRYCPPTVLVGNRLPGCAASSARQSIQRRLTSAQMSCCSKNRSRGSRCSSDDGVTVR